MTAHSALLHYRPAFLFTSRIAKRRIRPQANAIT
jgi:hypothetical protein